jgi:dipeptidyl aminopeptidase/acylaminoacyl peptidase
VKSAVNFILEHANAYQINTGKLVLLGASAGAHLAMLQGYKYTNPQVRAVINFFGPVDLITMYNEPWHPMIPYLLNTLTGTTPTADFEVYKNASPISFIKNQTAPTLILHGGRDQVVHPSQSKLLKQKLDSAGVVNELVIYPTEAHGWHGSTLSNSFDRIEQFLKKVI